MNRGNYDRRRAFNFLASSRQPGSVGFGHSGNRAASYTPKTRSGKPKPLTFDDLAALVPHIEYAVNLTPRYYAASFENSVARLLRRVATCKRQMVDPTG